MKVKIRLANHLDAFGVDKMYYLSNLDSYNLCSDKYVSDTIRVAEIGNMISKYNNLRNCCYYVAEIDGIIVGLSSGLQFKKVTNYDNILKNIKDVSEGFKVWYFRSLYVHLEYQRKGIGQLLLDKHFWYAEKVGYNFIVLTVDKHNEKAIQFYQKNNFKVEGDVFVAGSFFDHKLLKNKRFEKLSMIKYT